MSLSKKNLRQEAKKKLASISKNNYKKKSLSISLNILSLIDDLKQSSEFDFFPDVLIGVYAPLADEPYWPEAFLNQKFRLCFPRASKDTDHLYFVMARFDELRPSKEFGSWILCPIYTEEKNHHSCDPDLLLIPGLGFTKLGERLGRGKGYYDRYLENYKGIKIGLSFDELIFEEIPTESHDEVLDYIITESKILKINK